MRKLPILALLLLPLAVLGDVHQAEYGVGKIFNFVLYDTDGTLDTDEVDGGSEVSLSCNEGAETTATNDFVDEGTFYSIALTAAELQCARVAVVIAATDTNVFFIETVGHASAQVAAMPSNTIEVDGEATGVIIGQATTGTLSTTQATTNLTGYGNDQLIGRVVIWLSGDAEGEASDITDYVSSGGRLTFTALTTAPANGDRFKIL